MTGRRVLTEAQILRIVALREKGWGLDRIAKEMGCALPTVRWHCLKHGVLPPKGGDAMRLPPEQPTTRTVGGRIVRLFTAEEDVLLKVLEMQGFKLSVIARRMNRKRNSILGRLLTLARHDAIIEQRQAATP